jgi:hypothetical protein
LIKYFNLFWQAERVTAQDQKVSEGGLPEVFFWFLPAVCHPKIYKKTVIAERFKYGIIKFTIHNELQ